MSAVLDTAACYVPARIASDTFFDTNLFSLTLGAFCYHLIFLLCSMLHASQSQYSQYLLPQHAFSLRASNTRWRCSVFGHSMYPSDGTSAGNVVTVDLLV